MNAVEITKKLINLVKPSDEINGDIDGMEEIFTESGWGIDKIYTTNPVNGNKIPHYLLTIGNGKKHIGFISHYDVVGYSTGWDSIPNIATEKNGKIYGRGACDMLSGLAAELTVGRKFKDKFRFTIFLVGDEEIDQNTGMQELINANKTPLDYIIGSEPTSNEIAGDAIKIGRRGRIAGIITLYSESFHTAYTNTFKGINLPEMILNGGFESILKKYDNGVGMMPPTSFAINNIESEYIGANTVPGSIKIGFDARISSHWNTLTFLNELKTRLDGLNMKYSLDITGITVPYYTEDIVFNEQVSNSIEKVIGKKPELNCAGGTSDCRYFGEMNIPIVEIGVENSTIHKINENVKIQNIEILEKIYCQILENL